MFDNIKPYKPENNVRVITATSLFDGHDASINIMRRLLMDTGVEVIHLGHNRSVNEIVDAAIEEDVQGIAISSYQGGHVEFFKYMIDLLKEKDASHIKIFGGGGGVIVPDEIRELEEYGVTRIYSPEDGTSMGLQGIINDLVSKIDFSTIDKDNINIDGLSSDNKLKVANLISAVADTEFHNDVYLAGLKDLVKEKIKDHLYEFIEKFKIDIIVPENVLTIPLNIPLGMAITEIISEIGVPTIAHHHDFFWERQNFLRNAIWEYLNMSFPPHLPNIHHVIINSSADNQLSLRTGVSATIIPNVMDFHNPPPPLDEYASDVRQALGIEDDELFILQPTRVVKRKGIEHAIELVSRMDEKAKLVISHASGDEGYDYENRIRDYSNLLNVNTLFVSEIINEERGLTEDGRKIYTLDDIYPHADLVTYPSNFEGFGNAFLEAIYFRKPIVVNNYSIYSMDIKPKGFSVVEIDGYVTEEAVQLTKKVLSNTEYREKMIEHNYKIATRYFSYAVLREKLKILIDDCIR